MCIMGLEAHESVSRPGARGLLSAFLAGITNGLFGPSMTLDYKAAGLIYKSMPRTCPINGPEVALPMYAKYGRVLPNFEG